MAQKVSAQGTTLKIGVTGTAKNITAATKAALGVFTAAAHGFSDGQVLLLGSLGGMVEANGKAGVAINCTTNTFSIAGLDTTSFTTYTSGGTATPSQIQLGNLQSYNGFDGQKSENDVTDFDSEAKEFIPGLEDFGQISCEVFTQDADQGQMVLHSNKAAPNITSPFVITLRNGHTRSFSGFVKQFSEQGAKDGVVSGSFAVRISGKVVRG